MVDLHVQQPGIGEVRLLERALRAGKTLFFMMRLLAGAKTRLRRRCGWHCVRAPAI